MRQLVYKILYSRYINPVLRTINKIVLPILPKKIKIPPSGMLKVKLSDKNYLKIVTNQTNYITHLLFWEGGPIKFEYTSIFLDLIKKVNTFYDIGANIGYYSLLASKMNPDIRIVSFEPAGGSFHYFLENIRINKIRNITALPIALSQIENDEIEFYEVKNSKYRYLKYNLAGEGNTGSKTHGRDFEIRKVKTRTLDGFVKQNNESGIDLIKMDTEGTENRILEKSVHVLSNFKPIVICEILYDYIEKELEDIFSFYGYEFYLHKDGKLKKQKSLIRDRDDGLRDCFFVHPSKYHLIEKYIC